MVPCRGRERQAAGVRASHVTLALASLPHAGVLEQRQAAVAAAIEAEQLAAKTPGGVDGGGPRISAAAGDELAEQLRRRQAAAKAVGSWMSVVGAG